MSARVLLDLEVGHLDLWLPEACVPADGDLQVQFESAMSEDAFASLCSDVRCDVPRPLDALLDSLRQRHLNALPFSNVAEPLGSVKDFWTRDVDGHVQRRVAARVYGTDDEGLFIDLNVPSHKALAWWLRGLEGEDLLLVLAELIRLLANVVCTTALPQSIRSNVVGGLRLLVGLARTTDSSGSHDEAAASHKPGDQVAPVHAAQPSQRSGVAA